MRKLVSEAAPKSYSLDPIPNALLKTCHEDLVLFVANIVNHSLLSGSIPRCFKQALVGISSISFEKAQS